MNKERCGNDAHRVELKARQPVFGTRRAAEPAHVHGFFTEHSRRNTAGAFLHEDLQIVVLAEFLDNGQECVIDVLVHDNGQIRVCSLGFPLIDNALFDPIAGHGELFGRVCKCFAAKVVIGVVRNCCGACQKCHEQQHAQKKRGMVL